MHAGCPRCGDVPSVGVLCAGCGASVAPRDGLLPEHVQTRIGRDRAEAWLVDGFGAAHPLATRTVIGRSPSADLVVLDGSVSREHAELARADGAWQVRDLGSRNGTVLDGQRVAGRATVPRRAVIKVGDVAFVFVGDAVALAEAAPPVIETGHTAGSAPFRCALRGERIELCVVGAGDVQAGGSLLYRDRGAAPWTEVGLPPLEFQLLRALCERGRAEADAPSRVRGCVPTKVLARDLPFQSRFANEENVRQVVRRLRSSLSGIGADGLIEAVPGRGYFVTWPIVVA